MRNHSAPPAAIELQQISPRHAYQYQSSYQSLQRFVSDRIFTGDLKLPLFSSKLPKRIVRLHNNRKTWICIALSQPLVIFFRPISLTFIQMLYLLNLMGFMLFLFSNLLSLSVGLSYRSVHDQHNIYSNFYRVDPTLPPYLAIGAPIFTILLVSTCLLLCLYEPPDQSSPNQITPAIEQNNLNAPAMSSPFTPASPQYQSQQQPPFGQLMQCASANRQPINLQLNRPRF